jgi:hypothetical protein
MTEVVKDGGKGTPGRKPKVSADMAVLTASLPSALLARLDAEADRRMIGRARLVQALIERALPDVESADLLAPTITRPHVVPQGA